MSRTWCRACGRPAACSPRTRLAAPRAAARRRELDGMVDRRVAGEPLEHLLGWATSAGCASPSVPACSCPAAVRRCWSSRGRAARRCRDAGRRRHVLRVGRRRCRGRDAHPRGTSCTPPTWIRSRSPARAATCQRWVGWCTSATCTTPLPAGPGRAGRRGRGERAVRADASDRDDAARGARPRARDRAGRRRRRAGRAAPGHRRRATLADARAAGCWSRPARNRRTAQQPRSSRRASRPLSSGRTTWTGPRSSDACAPGGGG